jgi:effector-binding domain-containing protein
MSSAEPSLAHRSEQHYAAMRVSVPMAQIPEACPPLIGQVIEWLERHGAKPSGPPFFHYARITPELETIDVGFPTSQPMPGDDRVRTGSFPAGRYATLTHTGHYSGLPESTSRLREWMERQDLHWDTRPNGEFSARIEWYMTDPMEVTDPAQWVTELWMKVKGD